MQGELFMWICNNTHSRKSFHILLLSLPFLLLGNACATSSPANTKASISYKTTTSKEVMSLHIKIDVNGVLFMATMEKNATAADFIKTIKKSPLILTMKEYSGFEKVGDLGWSLPVDNQQLSARSGDIMIYQGNKIVLFYGSNSWSYTKLGSVDDRNGWKQALGQGDVQVTFFIE